jgi:hypothetical protein
MTTVLAALAVILAIGGFVGFAYGGLPTLVCWALAALCIYGGWRLRRARGRVSGPPEMMK